jgi:hypothetical protein
MTGNPSLDYGHFALGSILGQKGQAAQARLSFLRAIELNPSGSGSMSNLSELEAGLGRLDESLYWARRSFQLAPNRGAVAP